MRLKSLLFFYLLLAISDLLSQTALKKDSLVESILDSRVYSTYDKALISSNLDSAFLQYHLKELNSKTKLTNRQNGTAINLSKDELRHICSSFENQLRQQWKKTQFPNTELIEFEEIKDYLALDFNNQVAVISQPIYLRNNSLALVFFSNLCCGKSIGGFVELSLYKKENEEWEKYIEISGGDF